MQQQDSKAVGGNRRSRNRESQNHKRLPATIDRLESRRLLSNTTTALVQEPITIGVPQLKDITFVATNGRKTTLSVSAATASVNFSGAAFLTFYKGHAFFPAGQVETISSIDIANAVPGAAALKEVGAFGTGVFNIGSITGGDIKSIIAPDVNLTGGITLQSVQKLTLGQISGATLNLGASANTIRVSGATTGNITAGSIGSLKTSELLQSTITTTNPFSKSALEIGMIDAGSAIEQTTITSAGNIGVVKAMFLDKSAILAATVASATSTYPSADLPANVNAFIAPAVIHSINIYAPKQAGFTGNSIIGASTIVTAQLGQLNGGGGLAAHAIGSLSASSPAGQLDRIVFHLGPGQLHTKQKLQEALARLNIAYTPSSTLLEDTVFYDFNLNILFT